MDKLMEAFSGAGLDLGMRWRRRKLWGELIEQSAAPAQTQAKVLAEILARNADTIFGRKHGFGSIRGYAEFAKAVPVSDDTTARPRARSTPGSTTFTPPTANA